MLSVEGLLDSGADPKAVLFNALLTGKTAPVDLTVGDIYGPKCDFLPLQLIASTLGKAGPDAQPPDFLKSYSFLLLSNIGLVLRQTVASTAPIIRLGARSGRC